MKSMTVGRRIKRSAVVVCCLVAAAWLFGLASTVAAAQKSRTAYLPLAFHAEARTFRTKTCLQVTELTYPRTPWWENLPHDATAEERAFKAVLAAIRNRDREALFNLSDPAQGRDPKRFDEQAAAFFEQFKLVELGAVPLAYALDGMVVFFGEFRFKGRTFSAPLAFVYGDDGAPRFLPYRTEQLTFQLVEDWYNAAWGPGSTGTPQYCTDEEIKRATHRVQLASQPAPKQIRQPSSLLFTGALLDTPGPLVGLAARIKSTNDELKTALAGRMTELAKHMTPEGAGRLKTWLDSASERELDMYRSALANQRPFFVIDASPLTVVYTRSSAGSVNVMYFTPGANGVLLWTNSSHVTVSDRLFKRGAVYAAARSNTPFADSAIR